ncbi:Lipoprotein OS=Streptomyces antimycoticus OX=68175 GN=SSPO_062030 PE=4 SV=1 [Streptomyces antimycoticus]
MSVFDPSRRQLLIRSGALAGAAALASLPGSALLATPAYAASSHSKTPTGEEIRKAYRRFRADQARVLMGRPSPHGGELVKATGGAGTCRSRPVPGTPLEGVTVRIGAPVAGWSK